MSYAAKIIQAFGGSRKMGRALSVEPRHYPATTIQSWKDAGLIPAQHHHWVLQRSREMNIGIEPKDFFEVSEEGPERQAS